MEIVKSKLEAPRILVYGKHKIGKSTFAAGCPKPIFLATEDGLGALGVDMIDCTKGYVDVLKAIKKISETDYRTIVIDSLDWLEKLIFEHVKAELGWNEINPPNTFGRGYIRAEDHWRYFIGEISKLHKTKKMMPVFIAHTKVSKFEDPERDNYDQYRLDLQDRAAGVLSEYVDIIAFVTDQVVTKEKKEEFGSKVIKAQSTGERIMKLGKSAAYEAGNRYGLPDELPLSWQVLARELKGKKKVEGNLQPMVEDKMVKELEKISGKEEVAA